MTGEKDRLTDEGINLEPSLNRRDFLKSSGATVSCSSLRPGETRQSEQANDQERDKPPQQPREVTSEWYGPESGKEDVSPQEGHRYTALDTGYEYYGTGSTWNTRSFGTPFLTTDELAVTPVKIGLLADPHYPGRNKGLGAVGAEQTEQKLAEFVGHMNDWEADHVIFMGDMTHEQGTRADSQAAITAFRSLVEETLDMPTHMVWGNHEYGNAEDWGADWSYEPWGIAQTAETWYSVDTTVAKLLVLNNGYSEKNRAFTQFPQAEIGWLENELQTTRKPTVVLSHLPLSIGNGEAYDRAGNEEEVAQLLSRYDNVICCLFGHCHHDSNTSTNHQGFYPNPFFDQLREQRAYGMRHIYVPWIHRLQWNPSYTPYGLLYLYPNGRARLETPYSETDTREVVTITTGAHSAQFSEDTYLRNPDKHLRWETHFDSLAGFSQETTGTGRITLTDRGVELTTRPVTDDQSTDTKATESRALLGKRRGFTQTQDPVLGGWTNCIWRCYVKFEAVQDATVELLWGALETAYVGYRIRDGTVIGVREDGSGEVTTRPIRPIKNGQTVLFQLYYSVEFDRVDFIVGKRGTRPKHGLALGSPPDSAATEILFARISAPSSTTHEQSVIIGWVEVDKHPDLMIRQ
ncbi:metallophosphoesterase family protein [Halorussus salinisoli]|uniref:metallophosphoesterase family protein n=1 Tax=Halorussus salinisoli TaxID=2558242 RepID=UPI0010C206E1|nr:metallophosphoesterase [Halorussus salinisoli]